MPLNKLTPAILAALVAFVSLWPSSGTGIQLFSGADKAGHFLMYAILSFFSVRAFNFHVNSNRMINPGQNREPDHKNTTNRKISIIAVCSLYGFLLEILQEVMPYGRTFEWGDAAANTIGAATGIITENILTGSKK